MSDVIAAGEQGEVEDLAVGKGHWADFLSRYVLLLLLLGMIVIFSIIEPSTFFTTRNFKSILNGQVIILLLAVGVVAPFIVGEFDLSIGYVLGLSQAIVIGFMAKSGMAPVLAVVLSIAICCGVGFFSGILVTKAQVSSIIATLGVGSIIYGFVYAYTGGQVLYQGVPPSFLELARNQLFGVSLPVYYALAIVIALELFFVFTTTGRRLFAIGGNRQAAVLSGVRVKPAIIATFIMSAGLAGVSGVILASRIGTAQADTGPSLLLPAFAAVFLGATSIRPGHFNILGTVIAVYVLAVPIAGLQQLGVPSWFELVFNGVALIVAVAASKQFELLKLRREKRRRMDAFREGNEAMVGANQPAPAK